jgi:hypothetical protein
LLGAALWLCSPAGALILAPTTLDGPGPAIGEFGGAAVSADGTGGLVYVKQVEGVPHVFAAQFAGGHWQSPVRVDWASPYDASYPRVAAAQGGRLLVVWVTQIATVNNRIQRALVSSTLDPGASSFGPPYIVDPNVGEGAAVNPSLAMAATGQGLVAYRVVTNNYLTTQVRTTIPQLRPGDVLADIRVAVYGGQLWSSPQRVNRDPLLSMRAPTELNGPQAALGRGNQAVVAWQEPESNGTARIWARRIFATTLGLVLPTSPSAFAGAPLTQDADAFALSVSAYGAAKLVSRVVGTPNTPLSQARLFVSTMPSSTALTGRQFSPPAPLTAATPPNVGVPSVAVDERGAFRIAFTTGEAVDVLAGEEGPTAPPAPEVPLGPTAAGAGANAVTVLNPVGGGVTAWLAGGTPGVAVREDFPGGGAQTAFVSGAQAGPVSQLAAGGSEAGESVVGFRQGESGAYEIVGEPVSVPPPPFLVEVPRSWVRPNNATVTWGGAEDATGGVTYSVLIDGRVVSRGLHGLGALPDRRALGSGVRHVQVLATDASGQQTLSSEHSLMVDGSAPVASARRGRARTVTVRVKDAQSGAVARDTRISFGDGTHASGKLTSRHAYRRAGRYTIVVQMRDRVGNEGAAHLRVSVR